MGFHRAVLSPGCLPFQFQFQVQQQEALHSVACLADGLSCMARAPVTECMLEPESFVRLRQLAAAPLQISDAMLAVGICHARVRSSSKVTLNT